MDLDASDLSEGAITDWTNAGSLGESFTAVGDPVVKLVDQVKAVQLGGDGDWFVGPIAPDSVTAHGRCVDSQFHGWTRRIRLLVRTSWRS